MTLKTIIYSKPQCIQCTATISSFDKLGIPYEVIDLSKDADAMALVRSLGYMQAPVVVCGAYHWAGFRPDKIANIINYSADKEV